MSDNGFDEKLSKSAEEIGSRTRTAIERLGRSVSSIISIFILVSCILAQFLITSIRGNLDAGFFVALAISLAMMLAIRFTWLQEGRRRGGEDATFLRNKESAGRDVSEVYKNKELTLLNDYCINYATPQNREDVMSALLESVTLDTERYRKEWAHLSKEAVDKLTDLTQKQRKVINRLNAGKFKYPKISASELTGGFTYHRARNVVENTEKQKFISLNVFWAIIFSVTSFALNMVVFAVLEKVDVLAVITQSVLWIVSTLMSAVIGYNAGIKLITVNRNAYYVSIIRNLAAFNEWKAARAEA